MEWMDILTKLFEMVLLPLVGAVAAFLVVLIRRKGAQIAAETDDITKQKYINMLTETIADCVAATTQTYVDSLKAQGKFDAEAQKVAFNMSYTAVFNVLTEDAKDYLGELYGDLGAYVTQKIEAQVKADKKIEPLAVG
jgi:hypothetical protein